MREFEVGIGKWRAREERALHKNGEQIRMTRQKIHEFQH